MNQNYFKNLSISVFFMFYVSIGFGFNTDSIFFKNIASVNFHRVGSPLSEPIIELFTQEQVELSFDVLGTEAPFLNYSIIHCNADWTKSDLSPIEYLDGFNDDQIFDISYSANTLRAYTHYNLVIPNQNIRPKFSGNYLLVIYENDINKPVLTRRFFVYEKRVDIDAYFSRATRIEDQLTRQELNFTINKMAYPINALHRMNVFIKQNGRNDNMIVNPKYLSVNPDKIIYENTGNIVFDGGGEFRAFDIKSVRYNLENVQQVKNHNGDYHAWLYETKSRQYAAYESNPDINGRYFIKTEDWNDPLQAEYVNVHFFLKTPNPFLDGDVYVFGQLTDWKYLPEAKMKYVSELGGYNATLLLKQGYYNYQYMFVPFQKGKPDVSRLEGNFWQANNDYTIFVYYREDGAIADKLVGLKQLNSLQRR